MKKYSTVGNSIPRIDAYAKVTGRAEYVGDIQFPGMLHAKLLRSPHPHAEVRTINTSRAESLPGVVAIATYKDVPNIHFTLCGHPCPDDTPRDSLIISRRLRYVGDVVAAVAAETLDIAQAALELIDVEYEVLPASLTVQESLDRNAIQIHPGTDNLMAVREYEYGEVDSSFEKADLIVEGTYETPVVTHSPIEPHVSIAQVDHAGCLTVYSSTQVPSVLRQKLSFALGLQMNKVRVVKRAVGGGFGGKQEPVYEPVNSVLAQMTSGRPVKLELTREECLATTRTRHSLRIHIRSGVMCDGTIIAREGDAVQNTGAYSSHGPAVMGGIGKQFLLLYPTPNIRFSGKTVYTNTPIAGAMRAYGAPQVNFALESHLDLIAQKLGMDPLQLRRKNYYKPGDTMMAANMTVNSYGLEDCIERAAKRIDYASFVPQQNGEKFTGIGMSLMAYGQSTYGSNVELSGARMMVHEDGTATLFVGSADIGQGSDTAMQQIAAEALGVPSNWVTVVTGDTDVCPFDVGAFASRQTYVTGQAVKKAGLGCKHEILASAAKQLKLHPHRLDILDGCLIDTKTGQALTTLDTITSAMVYSFKDPQTICYEAWHSPDCNVTTFGATFAKVEVDTGTGAIHVLNLVSVLDSGQLINPLMALGQIYGGSVMSFGFGMMEQLLIAPNGQVYNDNLMDYKIPTFADIPNIDASFVETYESTSAYGNKSLGEPPAISPASAIRNAVCNAIGVEINTLPLTPERVREALVKSGKY